MEGGIFAAYVELGDVVSVLRMSDFGVKDTAQARQVNAVQFNDTTGQIAVSENGRTNEVESALLVGVMMRLDEADAGTDTHQVRQFHIKAQV